MFVTVTITAQAQSKDELINTFAAHFDALKQHCQELHKEGVFGDPAEVELRFVVRGGVRVEKEPPAEIRERGTPDVE